MTSRLPAPALTLLAAALLATGCGEDILQPDGFGITGTWAFSVDVFAAFGSCVGEDEEPVGFALVAIVEDEESGSVMARSRWFADTGEHTFTGTRVGNRVIVMGSYLEEGELLEATYTLTVSADENTMTGREDWDWDGACTDSWSEVTATRN